MRLTSDVIDVAMYQIERWFGDHWWVIEPAARLLNEPLNWCGNGGRDAAPMAYDFSACGKCWQQTSEHGTFDRGLATKAFLTLVGNDPANHYRMVRRHFRIDTVVLFEKAYQ